MKDLETKKTQVPEFLQKIDIETLQPQDIRAIRLQAQCFVGLANMITFLGITRDRFFEMVKSNHRVVKLILLEERNHYMRIRNQYEAIYEKTLLEKNVEIEDEEGNTIKRPAKDILEAVKANFAIFYKDFHDNSISKQIDDYNSKYLDVEIKQLLSENEVDTTDKLRRKLIDKLNKETKTKSKDYTFKKEHLEVAK